MGAETATPAILGVVAWIFVVIWVLSVGGWTISGDMDGLSGFIAIGIGIGLGFMTISPPVAGYGWVPFAGMVVTMLMYVPIREGVRKRQLFAIDLEQMEKCYENLRTRPQDTYAVMRLAEILYARGLTGQAVALAEGALGGVPKDLYEAEWKQVEDWRRQVRDRSEFRALPCLRCGVMNSPGVRQCQKCHSDFLLDYARGRWFGVGQWRKLFAGWFVLMVAVTGIPLAGAAAVPVWARVGVVSILMVLSGYLVWRAFTTETV